MIKKGGKSNLEVKEHGMGGSGGAEACRGSAAH